MIFPEKIPHKGIIIITLISNTLLRTTNLILVINKNLLSMKDRLCEINKIKKLLKINFYHQMFMNFIHKKIRLEMLFKRLKKNKIWK